MTNSPVFPPETDPDSACLAMMHIVGLRLRGLSVDVAQAEVADAKLFTESLSGAILDFGELLLSMASIERSLSGRLEILESRLDIPRIRARSLPRVESVINEVAERVRKLPDSGD